MPDGTDLIAAGMGHPEGTDRTVGQRLAGVERQLARLYIVDKYFKRKRCFDGVGTAGGVSARLGTARRFSIARAPERRLTLGATVPLATAISNVGGCSPCKFKRRALGCRET